jgi:surface antigen Omp85-like protein
MVLSAARKGLAPIVIAAFACLAPPCAAQTAETRAAEMERQQAEKAQHVTPYQRNFAERQLLSIEEAGGFAVVRGFFVTFGDIKRGSSIALGPAYGKTFSSGAIVIGKATYSIRDFKLGQLFAQAPPLAGGRLIINGRARWQDAPELAVYPLGPSSPKTRANYAEEKTEASAQAFLYPVRLIRLGAGTAFEKFDTAGANNGRHPSVEEAFTPGEMPGIGADPEYLHSFVSAGLDSLTGPGFSRTGTLLEASWHDYREQNDSPYSFRRVDGIARQMIPILHGNWVFDLSLRVSTTYEDGGEQVPFFLMPDLGGGSELRGFPNYRFRDKHSILATAEYRWYVQEYLEMAIFYDAGKVVPRRGDLDFSGLKSDVGIGLRFHSPRATALRFELARSNEGLRFIFGFGPAIK